MNFTLLSQINEAYRHGVYAEETLSEEELVSIEEWVEALIEEGYDLDQYSDEELYEAYLVEMNQPIVRTGTSVNAAGEKIDWKHKHNPNTGRSTVTDKFGTRDATVRGNKDSDMRNKSKMREELDLYDIVSEYLVSEGFCDSYEDADVIMANMSEEWRESIMEEVLDEAVRGSQRSIADIITGSDIRRVTRGNKDLYKKPEWKDKIDNITSRKYRPLRQGPEKIINNRTESERQKANAKSINRLNAKPNLANASEDDMNHIQPEDKTSYYLEIPTDYRARRRRASGR